jgi:hypothetical protein
MEQWLNKYIEQDKGKVVIFVLDFLSSDVVSILFPLSKEE